MLRTALVVTIAGLLFFLPAESRSQARGCGAVNSNTNPQRVMQVFLCSVKDLLRDPDTARFRRLHVVKYRYLDGRRGWALCGEVNARNAYGGRTGWQGFAYTEGEHRLLQSTLMCDGERVLAGSR